MGIFAWVLVGVVAGWLAGQITKGSGFGLLGNLLLGLVGAVVGGWLYGLVESPAEPSGLVGSIIVATIGAIVLIVLVRMVGGRPARA